eukprot:gene11309-biopygen12760
MIAAAGAFPPLVALLSTGTSASVQWQAAAALIALTTDHDDKRKVAAADAIPPLVALLSTSTSASVQEQAAAALIALTTDNVDNQQKVAAVGAMLRLPALLSDSGTVPEVKQVSRNLFSWLEASSKPVATIGGAASNAVIVANPTSAANPASTASALPASVATPAANRSHEHPILKIIQSRAAMPYHGQHQHFGQPQVPQGQALALASGGVRGPRILTIPAYPIPITLDLNHKLPLSEHTTP